MLWSQNTHSSGGFSALVGNLKDFDDERGLQPAILRHSPCHRTPLTAGLGTSPSSAAAANLKSTHRVARQTRRYHSVLDCGAAVLRNSPTSETAPRNARPEHRSAGLQHERRVIKESPLPSTGFRTMTLESAYYLSQIVAAFAVASPLLFGGLQMQKNVRTQRAIMHQAVVSQTQDTTRFYDSSPNAEVCASLCSAEECMGLTPGEISIAGGIMRLNVLNLEEAHWQRDNGSLSEDAVQSNIASPQRRFAMPGIRTAFGIWHLAWSVFQVPGHSGRALRAP